VRPVPRRAGRALLLVLAGLLVAGCQVRAELNVSVEEDGSGVVELAVGLDEDALSRRPDVLEDLDLSDLTDTGWEIVGPVEEVDGVTWLRARHEFGTPEELGVLVDEVAGERGPFRDFELRRSDAFAETRYDFSGTVDFTAGAGALAEDPELAEALEAEPIELLEERLGAAIDELVRVQVAVRLPGSVESNAPTQASNGAAWQPSVVEREVVELRATGTVSRSERLVWVGVAVAAGFALLLYLLVRAALWRRRRRAARTAD
jgi:hypothetical protein